MTNAAPPDEKKKTPWWLPIIVVLGAAPAIFSLYILYFISRYSIAHDEERCPYVHVETRDVSAGVRVREESRRCIDEVEEHRWLVQRGTEPPMELGRYPLEAAQIEDGFPWTATLDDARVVITVQNQGRGEIVLREPRPGEMPEGP
ncbi:MAG: hypothetical protein J0L92_34775 [Deltaproteobacteria bacterium]|nr:hypothetical protein [Deltaproteobacteria bacterium]